MKEKLKKLGKKLLIVLIIIIVLFVSLFIAYQIRYNFSKKINDMTSEAKIGSYIEELQKIKEENDNVSVLSNSVQSFIGDDAVKINSSIENLSTLNSGNIQITFNNADEKIKNLSKGEIFYLEGNENSKFPQGFFGKVVSITENTEKTILITESPKVDEIFDMLDIDISQELTPENIKNIIPMKGVKISSISDNRNVEIATKVNNEQKPQVDKLTHLTFNDSNLESKKIAETENNTITEKITAEADFSETLQEIAKEELNGKLDEEALKNLYLKVNLEADFEHLGINSKFDFDLSGLHDLYFDIEKDISAKATIESGINLSIDKKGTSIGTDEIIELCGLDQKMFPLFYIDIGTKQMVTVFGGKASDKIEELTTSLPVSVGVIVYIDLEGNIEIGLSVEGGFDSRTGNRLAIVENDEWKFSNEEMYNEEKVTVSVTGKAKASADLNTGIDVLLNISSVNITDIALVKLGLDLEISANLKMNVEKTNAGITETHEESADGHLRLYLKILDIDVKFKLKNKLIPISVQKKLTFFDITLLEIGKKPDTYYNDETMKIGQVSGEDDKYNYYKTKYGTLIKEAKSDKYKETIYTKEFDQFCAIDESYLYVTVPADSGTFDIIRIDKDDDNIYRTIIEDALYVLEEDDEYIYYLLKDEENIIYRYKRDNGETEQFMTFDYPVQLMNEQEDGNFYVITKEEDRIAALFGEEKNYYYVVGKDKTIISDYGSEPTVEQYFTQKIGDYYVAQKLYTHERTRPTAKDVVFLNLDKSVQVQTKTDSGWKNTNLGILIEQKVEGGTGFNLAIYTLPNGEIKNITPVNSKYAMYTLSKSDSGEWYFFDQEDDDVVLYKLDANLANKMEVKRFSNDEFRCNMEDCSMETTDNVLYFYEIESDDTQVLYRYDLN